MISRAENIALGLYSLGLRKGDKVAILAANSPEWTLTDAAVSLQESLMCRFTRRLRRTAVGYIIKDSGAKVFFIAKKEIFERIKEILPECPTIEKLVFFDASDVEAPKMRFRSTELEKAGANSKAENPELIKELQTRLKPKMWRR